MTEEYSVYVRIIVVILILIPFPFFIYDYLKTAKIRKSNFVIGTYPLYALNYISIRIGNKVYQEWVLDGKWFRSLCKGYTKSERTNAILTMKKTLKTLNSSGVRETVGNRHYAGKLSFKLSRRPRANKVFFTKDDYDLYKKLIQTYRAVRVEDRFNSMSRKAWNEAALREDLSYDIERKDGREFSEDDGYEIAGLQVLIEHKNQYTKAVKKVNSASPIEYRLIHGIHVKNGFTKDKQNFVYEPNLDKIRDNKRGYFVPNHSELSDEGVHVGASYFYKGQGNFLTVGGARSGKGTCLILPQILDHYSYDGSIVAVDVKGTLTAITREKLGNMYQVIVLDPWNTQKKMGVDHNMVSHSFNPLDILDDDPDNLVDDCDMIAEMIVPVSQESKDRYWEDRARQWVSTYLLYMATMLPKEERTLSKLRSLFKQSKEESEDMNADILANSDLTILKENFREIYTAIASSEKEALGVLSSVQREIDVFKSPAMERSLSNSSFDIKEITKEHKRVFVVIPPERLVSHSKWLRLIVGCVINTVMRHKGRKVLLLMDEFYSLGYMDVISKSMGLMPEYDLQLWAIVQDLSQLQEHYPKTWETFIANSAVTTWLGIRDNKTSEYLSKLIGRTLVNYKSDKAIREELHSGQIQNHERFELAVQTPDKIRSFDGMFALIAGEESPMMIPKTPYYEVPDLLINASINPLFEKGDDNSN